MKRYLQDLADRAVRTAREQGYSALLWKILWKLPSRGIILQLLVIGRFTSTRLWQGDLESAVDFAFLYNQFGLSIEPAQIKKEILDFCRIVDKMEPRTVLEIGTDRGGTLFLFSRVAAANALIISVDLPAENMKWRSPLLRSFARPGQRICQIRQNSHAAATLEKVNSVLKGRGVDLLFIDGDHTYEGVKRDFENYAHFVSQHGIIVFHDINPSYSTRFGITTETHAGEVYQFWDQIKKLYSHLELIKDSNQDGFGIGILFLDTAQARAYSTLVK